MSRLRLLGIAFLASGVITGCDSGADLADGEIASVDADAPIERNGTVGTRYQPLASKAVSFASKSGASASLVPLYHIAAPGPTHATHLTLGNEALAGAYLVPGVEFGGGADIVDLGRPENSEAYITSYMDLAGVKQIGSDLYLSGSLDEAHPSTENLRFSSMAVFSKVDSRGRTRMVDLDADFVMDAVYPESGNFLYAVTGYDGSLYRIHKNSLSAKHLVSVLDLRSVVQVEGGDLLVLDGGGGVQRVSDKGSVRGTVHQVEPFAHGAIAKMHEADGRIYVPNGRRGLDVIQADGTLLYRLDIGTVKSVAASGDLVAIANADDGVLLAAWENGVLVPIGQVDFGETQVNHVAFKGTTLYAAAGERGVYAVDIGL